MKRDGDFGLLVDEWALLFQMEHGGRYGLAEVREIFAKEALSALI
ncbi:hypothetical protein [Paraburkholderia caribensis]|nr:hypothetical protein [Paraburkholderia caribensis]